jgi:hypothetical protein
MSKEIKKAQGKIRRKGWEHISVLEYFLSMLEALNSIQGPQKI